MSSKTWFRYASLNTLEQAVMRFSDAGTTFVLLWFLSSEVFAELAIAQAWIAPILFFFLSPENIIYRDYSKWKELSPEELQSKISLFRQFGYLKAIIALFISLCFLLHSTALFISSIWAFTLVLTPQFCGMDREYLRLSLNLKKLNTLTLIQKLSLFILVLILPKTAFFLALSGCITALLTVFIARFFVQQQLQVIQSTQQVNPLQTSLFSLSGISEIKNAMSSFSIWSHINGVITNWVQTLDVFLMGYIIGTLSSSQRELSQLGQYAAMLKIANFTTTLPLSLSNLFTIWINQTKGEHHRKIIRYSFSLLGLVIFQGALLLLFANPLLELISRGRWSIQDQDTMILWMSCFILSLSLFAFSYIPSGWFMLRNSPKKVTLHVYLPWMLVSAAIYSLAILSAQSASGNIFSHAAVANIFVYAALGVFIGLFSLRALMQRGRQSMAPHSH